MPSALALGCDELNEFQPGELREMMLVELWLRLTAAEDSLNRIAERYPEHSQQAARLADDVKAAIAVIVRMPRASGER